MNKNGMNIDWKRNEYWHRNNYFVSEKFKK